MVGFSALEQARSQLSQSHLRKAAGFWRLEQ